MTRSGVARRVEEVIGSVDDELVGIMLVRVQRLQEFRLVHGYAASDAVGHAAGVRIRELLRPLDELVQALGARRVRPSSVTPCSPSSPAASRPGSGRRSC